MPFRGTSTDLASLVAGIAAVLCCSCDQSTTTQAPPPAGSGAAAPASMLASASAPPGVAKPAANVPRTAKGPFNVLFLTVDSLRADMPWTGYSRAIAPNLTELSKQAVVYPRAYSVASYTAKSVGVMLSGRYPSSLYRTGTFFTAYSDANVFVTELFQKAGIHTLSGHAHLYFDRGKNLNQGFDVWELVKGLTFDSQTDNHVTSNKLTDLAISLLSEDKNTNGLFFAWFHYMDPHDQYVKHAETPDFGRHNRDRYDSEIHYADQHIGRLLQFAKSQPWWSNTAVIVSADHGEAFGEHGMYKHAFEVWDVLTRVPLVIMAPGVSPRHIDERRSHIDLAATFAALLGVALPPGTTVGRSLVPELYGATAESREPIVLDLPEDTNNPRRRAVIQGDYKLIAADGSYQLYNLKDDPGETTNLVKTHPEPLQQMKQLFDATWNAIPQIDPYGGNTLKSGRKANGPSKPAE
jgi:arylsulfatase A-like enzyme